jgi:hypothetical protein
MPGPERLGNQPPGPAPDQDLSQGPGPAADETLGPDLAADAAAGYDPVAEAEAAMAAASAGNPGEGNPGEGSPDGGSSRLMGALRTAGNAMREGGRWAAPVVGAALQEEAGVDVYKFAGEQPELNEDQQFATGVTRWALRRGMEHLAERAATKA